MELGVEHSRYTKTRRAEKFRELKNWEFYSIASEEMMIYVDNDENQNFKRVKTETHIHTTTPVPKYCHTKIPTCMNCSM